MLVGEGFIGFLLLLLWVYAVLDVIATESLLCRSLPKLVWLLLVVALPDLGALAWLALGRPIGAGWWPGDTSSRPLRRFVAPEDRDDWATSTRPVRPSRPATPSADAPDAARERRLMEWEADLRRREQALGSPPPEDHDTPD